MNLEESDNYDFEIPEIEYTEIKLETDDISMVLSLKKDYSKIEDIDEIKSEFIKDIKDFIDEFASNPEFDELMEYY